MSESGWDDDYKPLTDRVGVYIAGPMSGLPDFNYPAFTAAAADLRARGYRVTCPSENFNGNTWLPKEMYLERAMQQVLSPVVSEVWVLPGWLDSYGSLAEVFLALSVGKRVVEYDTQQPVNDRQRQREIVLKLKERLRLERDPFEAVLSELRELHFKKRADYTASNPEDILHNYRASASLAGIDIQVGMFARMCEKIVRLSGLIGNDTRPMNEPIEDSLRDVAIIAMLMLVGMKAEA